VPIEGARNALRSALNWKGLFKFVPKADRAFISTKTNPIDGVLGFPPEDFVTYRNGVRAGAFSEYLFGGGRETCVTEWKNGAQQ